MFRPTRLPRAAAALGVAVAFAVPSVPDAAGDDDARLIATRLGRTTKGSTRVVFEADRAVEYLVVELADANGFEVHLLGVDPAADPPAPAARGPIRSISLAPSPAGIVARVEGGADRLVGTAFPLENPHRVVLDVRPERGADSGPPARRPARTAAVPTKPTPAPVAVARKTPAAPRREEPSPRRDTPPAPGKLAGRTAADEEFDDLLLWIHALKVAADGVRDAEDDAGRARHRRGIAYLLLRRGVLHEAAKYLAAGIAPGVEDPASAVADSVTLAEIRLRLGEEDEALAVAQAVDTARATASERVRLAKVLADARHPALAGALLERTIPETSGPLRARAQLLLARSHWDRRDFAPALALARELTGSGATPPAVLADALLLHADCLWARGSIDGAAPLYERAARLDLTPEQSAWAALQLGNAARRAGRDGDARRHWRNAVESWPDTFYAAQAGWMLRFGERLDEMRSRPGAGDRG